MKIFLKILGIISLSIIVLIIHIIVNEVLPQPFNFINVIFIFILLLLIIKRVNNILWLIFPLCFLLELYSSAPFGINTLALLTTFAIIDWALNNIFVHRSVYIAIFSSLFGILCYRLLFILFLIMLNKFQLYFFWQVTLMEILWEVTLTTSTLAIAYVIFYKLEKRFNPRYLNTQK